MQTTIMGSTGIIGYTLRLYRDNGKENENYYNGFIGILEGFDLARDRQPAISQVAT